MDIVAPFNASRRFCHWLAGFALVLAVSIASAGPGFIDSSRVSGDVSGDRSTASVEVRFNCKAQYLRHEPQGRGDQLRIYLDPTGICNGVAPIVAASRSRLRPVNADNARLVDLEYEGDTAGEPTLTLTFSEAVAFDVDMSGVAFALVVSVQPLTGEATATPEVPIVKHRQVVRARPETVEYIINLASLRSIPTVADTLDMQVPADTTLFYTETEVDDTTWYRLRLGNFKSVDDAEKTLATVNSRFPGAWIGKADSGGDVVEMTAPAEDVVDEPVDTLDVNGSTDPKVDSLMEDARKSIAAGDTSRAIQIYTKVLQLPGHAHHADAQEFLALAREKNGQIAHAKAEYQRYLSLYPESEGAARVSQRLAAILAGDRQSNQVASESGPQSAGREPKRSDWRLQTYFSQYYRRDANQLNDQDEVISQSALYSDVNIDARRRGERFDFSSRISAGYRSDFLDDRVGSGSGNELRVSYAYADLADAATSLRARIGRQSRNTGGVLGRFDGLNLGYDPSDRIQLNAVVGKPAYSSSDSIDSSRNFYGASINFDALLENLGLGMFYIEQNVEGIQDRQAVGAEFRYFGTKQSLWGLVDYDISYGELASAFLQGSWRFGSRLSLHARADRRGSPFLSTSNALIGQPVATFAELATIFGEDELRQLGQDRTSVSTTYNVGLSFPLSPKLQINTDVSQSTTTGTPASGGILATEDSTYRYYSGGLIASSLLKEGDVTILNARYSDSGTARVISMTLDSRYPIGRTWRINPRLRVDRRERLGDPNYEWLYTPGIRIQYRRSQKFRIDFEAGKQFSERKSFGTNLDRESYYVNLGYQSFF